MPLSSVTYASTHTRNAVSRISSAKNGNTGSYLRFFKSAPATVLRISHPSESAPSFPPFAFLVAPGSAETRASATMNTFPSGLLTYAYANVGLTHSARLEGRVQGVVVHATSDAPSSQPTTGNATVTAGSETSR